MSMGMARGSFVAAAAAADDDDDKEHDKYDACQYTFWVGWRAWVRGGYAHVHGWLVSFSVDVFIFICV
jgi:hypothetical protein